MCREEARKKGMGKGNRKRTGGVERRESKKMGKVNERGLGV